MYASDPTSVRQLRTADLITAEQSRSGRSPVSHRRSWFRRTVVDRLPSRRSPAPTTTAQPTLASYGSNELFAGLDDRSLTQLSESFMVLDVEPGHSLGRQGEAAPEFVVVLEGRIGVSLDGLPLAVLDAGSHFGAIPLLDDGPAPYGRASFDVLESGRVAVAGRLEFGQILESYPLVAGRIRAIADVRRAYLKGRADAATIGATAAGEFPVHLADVH
jgi:CRP-like cAMP-binding protein